MPFPVVPLTIASVAAWIAGSPNRRAPPPASWVSARGSLPTDSLTGRFVALYDPLRPLVLHYEIGSRVGLALRSAIGTIVRGEGMVIDAGYNGGVTVRWIATLSRLAGKGPLPPRDLIVRTGPEGIAWVFPMPPAPRADLHEDRLPDLNPAVIAAAYAAIPSSTAAPTEPVTAVAEVISTEPSQAASLRPSTSNGTGREIDLVIEPEVLTPLLVDIAGHDTALALSAFDVVERCLAENPHASGAGSFGEGAERVAFVRDLDAGYDAALYVDPDDQRARLAIWRPGGDPDSLCVYRAADVHAALLGAAPYQDESVDSNVEPTQDLPYDGRFLWAVEATAPDVARLLGLVALRPGTTTDSVNLIAKNVYSGRAPTPSGRLSGRRLVAWLLPAATTDVVPAAE